MNGSSEQETALQQREICVSISRRAVFGLRLRAGLAAPNRVWDLNPWFPLSGYRLAAT
jgi:hypothetical protein